MATKTKSKDKSNNKVKTTSSKKNSAPKKAKSTTKNVETVKKPTPPKKPAPSKKVVAKKTTGNKKKKIKSIPVGPTFKLETTPVEEVQQTPVEDTPTPVVIEPKVEEPEFASETEVAKERTSNSRKVSKGLSFLIISAIASIASILVDTIVNILGSDKIFGNNPIFAPNMVNLISLICESVLLVSFVVEFIGLITAARGNESIKSAATIKIFEIILGVIAVTFIVIASIDRQAKGDVSNVKWMTFVSTTIVAFCSLLDVFVIFHFCKGCREVSKVDKLSKFVFISSIIYTLFDAATPIYDLPQISETTKMILAYVGVATLVVALVEYFSYLIMIIRVKKQLIAKEDEKLL